MSTDERRVMLVDIVEKLNRANSFSGETHIQKAVYFLVDMLRVDLGFSFVLYKYGPFSFDLRSELLYLESVGVLERRESESTGSHFSPGRNSASFKSLTKADTAMYQGQINWIIEQFFGEGHTVAQLEKEATALFALKHFEGDEEAKAEKINQVKPHISVADAQEDIHRIHQLLEVARDEHETASAQPEW